MDPIELEKKVVGDSLLLSVSTVNFAQVSSYAKSFYAAKDVFFNVDLTAEEITKEHVGLLFNIVRDQPAKTFNFAYVFNNVASSPYFPSACYEMDGFSIGLQPTDLAKSCWTSKEWFEKMKTAWNEIFALFGNDPNFLGIDSSIAPVFENEGSLIDFVRKMCGNFSESVTTDFYLEITKFIKNENPKPVGLCGLMFPCLEDFELAEEYEQGNFSIERNLFLSLHSGLGIDTYPIGVDENPERILDTLKLVQGLSNKYKKPLSVRFVSDGRARIGEKTDFKNQYLKDVIIRKL
jgi:uncharacterized protein (UPF0210 family)